MRAAARSQKPEASVPRYCPMRRSGRRFRQGLVGEAMLDRGWRGYQLVKINKNNRALAEAVRVSTYMHVCKLEIL